LQIVEPEKCISLEEYREERLALLLGEGHFAAHPLRRLALGCHHDNHGRTRGDLGLNSPFPLVAGEYLVIPPDGQSPGFEPLCKACRVIAGAVGVADEYARRHGVMVEVRRHGGARPPHMGRKQSNYSTCRTAQKSLERLRSVR